MLTVEANESEVRKDNTCPTCNRDTADTRFLYALGRCFTCENTRRQRAFEFEKYAVINNNFWGRELWLCAWMVSNRTLLNETLDIGWEILNEIDDIETVQRKLVKIRDRII